MKQFQQLLFDVLNNGHKKHDRTGVGTISLFGTQMRFNLEKGFPICTTKKVPFNSVLSELLWFISGSSNVNDLRALLHGESNRDNWNMPTIWDANATVQGHALGYTDGELGPIYGKQWRSWYGIADEETGETSEVDQLAWVINEIKTNPDSRRLIVSAWHATEIDRMALPPCHCLFQFYVSNGKLSCQLYQRSADVFLGVPFNIASYALLTHMIARVCGLGIGEFIWTGGDVHLYNNHVEQAQLMLSRIPTELPTLVITGEQKTIDDFKMDDFTLLGYQPAPTIKADMAV